MANPGVFNNLVSTTFRNHAKQIKDNLSNRNALLKYMRKRGNMKKLDGGLTITTPLDYAENTTYQRYSDWDLLDVSQSEVITSAEYQWRQIIINIVASGRELRINSGDSKIVDLAEAKLKNAIRTFSNNFSSDLYSAGTLPNQINGLQALVADIPTGTVGGIDANAWSFWRNKVFSASANTVVPTADNFESDLMLPLWLQLDRGTDDCPDLIVADNNYYQLFEGSQLSMKRYTQSSSVDAGLVSIKYKKADVIFEGNAGIPNNHMYMLNTEYLKLAVHENADLEEMDEKTNTNQDGVVIPVIWMGNIICTNRAQQGVIIA